MRKPHLHILQVEKYIKNMTHVESPTVKKYFEVTKASVVQGKPDVVYCQTYGACLNELEKWKGKSIIFVGGDVWYELSKLEKFNRLNRITNVMKNATVVLCISQYMANLVCKYLNQIRNVFRTDKGLWGTDHNLRHGIVPKRFTQKKDYSINGEPIVVMGIALTVDRKYEGVPLFLEQTKELAEEKGVRFFCYGRAKGRNDLIEQWEKKYRFKFSNAGEKWPEVLSKADIFVHPSLFDGWPRVVAEAMCVGLPVLAYNVAGTPEVGNIDLVDPNNPEQVNEHFLELLELKKTREAMGETLHNNALSLTRLNQGSFLQALKEVL